MTLYTSLYLIKYLTIFLLYNDVYNNAFNQIFNNLSVVYNIKPNQKFNKVLVYFISWYENSHSLQKTNSYLDMKSFTIYKFTKSYLYMKSKNQNKKENIFFQIFLILVLTFA